MLGQVEQVADDRLDYTLNFEPWLDGDQITTATATVEGPDAALIASDVVAGGTAVTLWLSAGTVGSTYSVHVQAETQAGRRKTVCFRARISEC